MSIPEKIGRYEIIRELGRGGMAVVYLARDPLMARRVALKLLPGQLTFNESLRARFQREARIVASLEHPAIVPVHDFGEFNEQPYLVMRYMVGGSLSQYENGKPLALTEVVRILTPLSSALDKAHSQHIIHRDLKPDNILFDGDKNPYLSDFGIARLAEGTQTQSIMGTPAYMSPEQIKGDVELDGRSDIYALGVILFEMLSGQQPYTGDTPTGIMMKHVMDPVPRILDIASDLPEETQSIIDKAMAKDRVARFNTAEEMVNAISKLLTSSQAAAVGAAVAGTRVQETMLELPDDTPDAGKTIVESPRESEIEALYAQLQMANSQKDWVEVLSIGAKIQRMDPDYRDVPGIMKRAKGQFTQSVPPTRTALRTPEPEQTKDVVDDAVTVGADLPQKKNRPVWLIVGGVLLVLILLCGGGWVIINSLGGEPEEDETAASTSGLSASAGIGTKVPSSIATESSFSATPSATVDQAEEQATDTPQPTPTPTEETSLEPTPAEEQATDVPEVQTLFVDEFESSQSAADWDLWQGDDAEFDIIDGRLIAIGKNEAMLNWTRQQDNLAEFEAFVTASILEGGNSAFFGMVLAGEETDYFGCVVQGDNSAYCAQSVAGEDQFTDWARAPLSPIRGDEIHFVVSGGQWAMAVNGQCVGSGSNDFISEGQIGLVASTNNTDIPSRIGYDDFMIQSPSQEGLALLGCEPDFYE